MRKVIALAGQAVTFAMFALLVGWFSASPSYTHVDPAKAVIRLSFDHAAARVSECRPLTPEEIAELAPNMRRSLDCPRGRVPLLVELELDGTLLYRAAVPPSGIAGDGPATVYQRFVVPPGPHEVTARLRDSRRTQGFDYASSERVDLAASRNFVIDFRPETGGFIFK
jgi:hypothetical protein